MGGDQLMLQKYFSCLPCHFCILGLFDCFLPKKLWLDNVSIICLGVNSFWHISLFQLFFVCFSCLFVCFHVFFVVYFHVCLFVYLPVKLVVECLSWLLVLNSGGRGAHLGLSCHRCPIISIKIRHCSTCHTNIKMILKTSEVKTNWLY